MAPFSNYGLQAVDIAAPGVDILSTKLGGGYEFRSGSSMASPFVSGISALLLSFDPDLSVEELKERLIGI